MTSKQVMLVATALLAVGCSSTASRRSAGVLISPYPTRTVWAVVPLRNESGSLNADGAATADHLARQLENATNVDVLPVNRVLDAMRTMRLSEVRGRGDAMGLMQTLGVDGLIGILKQQGYPQTEIRMDALEEELLKWSNAIRLKDDLTLMEIHINSF